MKVSFLTTLFLAVALALETPVLERRAHAGTLRKFNGAAPPPRAAKVPSSAPAGYKTSVATANVKLSTDSLTPATLRRREDQVETRQVSASDFFECYNAVCSLTPPARATHSVLTSPSEPRPPTPRLRRNRRPSLQLQRPAHRLGQLVSCLLFWHLPGLLLQLVHHPDDRHQLYRRSARYC